MEGIEKEKQDVIGGAWDVGWTITKRRRDSVSSKFRGWETGIIGGWPRSVDSHVEVDYEKGQKGEIDMSAYM